MISLSKRNFYVWNALFTLVAIAFLFWLIYFREADAQGFLPIAVLPAVNASLNAICAVLLCIGFWAIKSRKEVLHKNLMLSAFIVSTLFLLSYVYYHSQQGDTKFLGEGWVRPVYFFVLISHIILSMAAFPMILTTLFFGLTDRRKSHRRIARITFPIWLYVSVTGVLIFFLLRAYS